MTSPTRQQDGTRPTTRLPLLDVLRGVAILGTLATNVWVFTAIGAEGNFLTDTSVISPMAAFQEDPSAATFARGLFMFAANGKFLSLLTLMFGVGLAIQFRSAARRGGRWPGPYLWRALFLFTEGLLHFALVFAGDVLMGYAAVSVLVAWLLTRSERTRTAVMWTAGAVHLALMSLITVGLALSPGSAGAPPPPGAAELYAEGSYLEQVAFRLDHALMLRIEPVFSFGLMLFMFLLGVRLFRAGAFGGDGAGRALRRRLLAWGLGVGVPFNAVTTLGGPDLAMLDRYVAAPVVALGIIGAVGWALDRGREPGPLVTSLSSLGRTAMSGYVLQNVLCMVLCYGFGLGLATRLAGAAPWWVMGLWAGVSALLLAASTLWLRRFDAGPLEALQKAVLPRPSPATAPGRSAGE
jgi:uncharacterized protein